MPNTDKKTFIDSLKADKWGLPLLNGLLIVFLGFLIFGTFVGFDEAITIYGFFIATIFALILSPLGKNTLAWYSDASIEFHVWFFVIFISFIAVFAAFVYPKKSK